MDGNANVWFNTNSAATTCSPNVDARADVATPNNMAECKQFTKLCFAPICVDRLLLRLRALNGTVVDLSPASHQLARVGKDGAMPTCAVKDLVGFSTPRQVDGDDAGNGSIGGDQVEVVSTVLSKCTSNYFVVEPTDIEKDLGGGSAAGVFERASCRDSLDHSMTAQASDCNDKPNSNSWSVSTWIKLSKYTWAPSNVDHAESLVIMSDLENRAGTTTGRDYPKYLEIHNGYMSYALGGDESQYHAKHASTQRIPLGKWAHLEWSVVDGTIRSYVNGVQTDMTQGPGVRDTKLRNAMNFDLLLFYFFVLFCGTRGHQHMLRIYGVHPTVTYRPHHPH